MDPSQFQAELVALQDMIAERYGVRGTTLAVQVKRLGRLLPRYERGQARVLIEAEQALGHPKMAMRIQPKAFAHAKAALVMHLEGVDRADRRKGAVLGTLTVIVVNVVLAVAALATLAIWQGLI